MLSKLLGAHGNKKKELLKAYKAVASDQFIKNDSSKIKAQSSSGSALLQAQTFAICLRQLEVSAGGRGAFLLKEPELSSNETCFFLL